MKTSSFHLNLLRTNEVLSSSPVRLLYIKGSTTSVSVCPSGIMPSSCLI